MGSADCSVGLGWFLWLFADTATFFFIPQQTHSRASKSHRYRERKWDRVTDIERERECVCWHFVPKRIIGVEVDSDCLEHKTKIKIKTWGRHSWILFCYLYRYQPWLLLYSWFWSSKQSSIRYIVGSISCFSWFSCVLTFLIDLFKVNWIKLG